MEVLQELEKHKAGFALKVPFWRCLDLQSQIRARRRWLPVGDGVDDFFTSITIKTWDRRIAVAIYRKRVFHETCKNYLLDLFDPDDGTWEYAVVATNLELGVRRLWRFMAGRGLHEKIIGELKSALALETIPTNQLQGQQRLAAVGRAGPQPAGQLPDRNRGDRTPLHPQANRTLGAAVGANPALRDHPWGRTPRSAPRAADLATPA